MQDVRDRLLTSESLAGLIPDLEEVAKEQEESFYVCTAAIRRGNDVTLVSGRVMYFSFDGLKVNIEFRVSLPIAFQLLRDTVSGLITCDSVYLSFGDDVQDIPGPFTIVTPRVADFDREERTCTLGLDMCNAT